MSLDAALNKAASLVPECLAAGYVDAESGMLLAIKTVDSHPREVIDLVAAATADLFNGPNVSMIERMFKKSRGVTDDGHHYFQEIIVNSDNRSTSFCAARSTPSTWPFSCAAARPTWAWP